MTKSTLNQFEYTRLFLREAGVDEETYTTDYWLVFWWNHTNPDHLRLSAKGIKFIKKETKIPIYFIEISHPLLSTHLIKLARINIGPYYLHAKERGATIMVLDQEVATMLTLHAGNLGQYLENLQL